MRPSLDQRGVWVPGKIILTGEHAVVYGTQALAASIGLGVKVRVKEGKGEIHDGLLRKAIALAGGDGYISIDIDSELPIGSGLGSSAAVAAAAILAVRAYLGKPIHNDDELFQLTMECERMAHGNPSGVDPATVIYRGLIAYTKGRPFERLSLKTPLSLMLVNSGKPSETTKEMVERVAANPQKEQVFVRMGKLSERIRQKLVIGRPIEKLLDINGRLLEKLGVVGKQAKRISQKLRQLGYSVKITGAGGVATGSGMLLVLGHDFVQAKAFLDNQQLPYFVTTIGGQ